MCDSCAPRPPSDDTTIARSLHRHIQQLVQLERRSMRELALGFARMHTDKLYRQLGYAGLVEYGEQAFGFSPSKVRQLAQLGRKLPKLPALDDALCSGALGWTKARTLLPVITADTAQAWVERALAVSNRELEGLVARAAKGDVPPEPDDDWEDLNFVWAKLRLDPLHFERLMQAVAQLRHDLGDVDMSLSQCLLAMADRVLAEPADASEEDSAAHVCHAVPVPARVIAHRCPSCERMWVESRAGRIQLEAHDERAVMSDAELVAGDDSAGTPGHLTRTIPPATRRAVLIRDGGRCQVPGCRCRQHVALHHIRFRSDGGDHSPDNLVTVCWAHHDMIHKGVVRLVRTPDGTLHWDRGPGEPLGLHVSIHRDRAELEHADLAGFEGPSGSWFALEAYFGVLEPLEVDAPPADATHVCNLQPPAATPRRYPHGRQILRPGDEARMAPGWLRPGIRA